ncbi:MAG: hypothetical protein HGA47_12015 [Zoogloea sp.]|nr:hypothetical protein [Zoogloea sp.]
MAQSALGEPLHVEVRLISAPGERADASCIKLFQTPGDDLPWVRNARITLEGRNRILINGREAVSHPIIMLGLKLGCGSELQREYPLLLQPPTTRQVQPPAPTQEARFAPPPARPKAPARSSEQGASSEHHGSTGTRRSAGGAASAVTARSRDGAREANTHLAAGTPEKHAAARQDHLVLAGDEPGSGSLHLEISLGDPSRVERTSDAERERLRQEQRLIQALDEKITTQLELADKLRQMEAFQASLANRANELGMRPQPGAAPVAAAPAAAEAPAAGDMPEWIWPVALAAGALAGGLGLAWLLRWRRRSQEYDLSDDTLVEDESADENSPANTSDLHASFSDDSIPYAAPEQDRSAQEWPEQALAGVHDEASDDESSALELAEIMMSFGRIQGAAETLADYIRQNPRQAVEPWVKLLEVYRAAGMRAEFEALTRQLNKTFNVKVVSWDEFDQARHAPDTIEQMPHIVKNLQAMWGTPAAQAYIHKLMRDNRDGTRQGFPLYVVDELLMLLAVLEQLCGPYKSTTEPLGAF